MLRAGDGDLKQYFMTDQCIYRMELRNSPLGQTLRLFSFDPTKPKEEELFSFQSQSLLEQFLRLPARRAFVFEREGRSYPPYDAACFSYQEDRACSYYQTYDDGILMRFNWQTGEIERVLSIPAVTIYMRGDEVLALNEAGEILYRDLQEVENYYIPGVLAEFFYLDPNGALIYRDLKTQSLRRLTTSNERMVEQIRTGDFDNDLIFDGTVTQIFDAHDDQICFAASSDGATGSEGTIHLLNLRDLSDEIYYSSDVMLIDLLFSSDGWIVNPVYAERLTELDAYRMGDSDFFRVPRDEFPDFLEALDRFST